MNSAGENRHCKIMVSGAAGFVGSHVVSNLLAEGKRVVALTRDKNIGMPGTRLQDFANHPSLTVLASESIGKPELHRDLQDVDALIHLASITEVPFSLEHPRMTFEVNHLGMLDLLEVARKLPALRHFVLISSAHVYLMPPKYLPIDEEHPADPAHPYGLSKLQQEQLARMYCRCYGIPMTILRSSLLFGERQRDAGINNLIKRAITDEPITIQGGAQTRDIYHVGNLIHAINLALSKKAEGELFNISGNFEISISELVGRIAEITNSKSQIKYEGYRPNESPETRMWLDISKAKKLLGYEPIIGFEQGLARTVAWLSDHIANSS